MSDATIRLSIDGMSCAGCASRVERALNAVPGVEQAYVNFAARTAIIEGDTHASTVVEAVQSAGYTAQPEAEGTVAGLDLAEETKAAKNRTLIAAALTAPVFVLEMGSHLSPAFHDLVLNSIGQLNSWGIQYLLTTLVLLWPGLTFFEKGVPALLRGAPEMNALVALGAAAAWGFSSVSFFAPYLLPDGTQAVYFEAAAVIVTLILLGRWLETRARGQAGAAIQALVGLGPKRAFIRRGDTFVDVPLEVVGTGDILMVKPGGRIPVDGRVISGASFVDESMISGEPMPVWKDQDAEVIGGTMNGEGALTLEATHVGRDTVLAQIIEIVRTAQGARLPIQSLADQVVQILVPAVMTIALLTVAAWLVFGPDPALGFALVAGVSVLIIACPCAMGLATPTSIIVGTGRAAELGVLFRKGDALQRLDDIEAIAFDKTGTLTHGQPRLTHFEALEGWSRPSLLRLVASAELGSEHPIGRALVQAASDEGIEIPEAADMRAISGFGLFATSEGRELLIGTARLLRENGIDPSALEKAAKTRESQGETSIFVAVDGVLAGLICVADTLKPSAKAAVAALKFEGLKLAMITGDNPVTARAIADELGIDEVHAEVLPAEKSAALRNLRARHGAIAFVGDGINDAPALAEADVGLAVGTGTDVAIETADILLVSGDLGAVATARRVSRRTMRNIRQNLFWAFGYNVALIPVAAGVLYPFTGTLLSPMLAAGAMALSSVFVVTNALRLRRISAAPEIPTEA